VTSTADSGAGTLRQAITDANADTCNGSIVFNIGGGGSAATITPDTNLPAITSSVSIDATTQGGWVELSGASVASSGKGFEITAGTAVIQGFVINQWTTAGIRTAGTSTGTQILGNRIGLNLAGTDRAANAIGILLEGSGTQHYIGVDALGNLLGNIISGNNEDGIKVIGTAAIIQGNYIGTQPSGEAHTDTTTFGNHQHGVYLYATSNSVVGGSGAGQGNVISGNSQAGIAGYVGSGHSILGNYIGTDKHGTTAIPNNIGIQCGDIGGSATIGDGTSTGRNLVSGNSSYGMNLRCSDNIVQGNYVGTDINGTNLHSLGNGNVGIYIHSSNSRVGGTETGEGNLVAFNVADGVGGSSGNNVAILGNSIFSNDGAEIELYGNGNTNNATPPTLSAVNDKGCGSRIQGSFSNVDLPNYDFRIEVFENPADGASGTTFLGAFTITTDGDGNATLDETIDAAVTPNYYVTVTATMNDTSVDPSVFKSTTPFSSAVQATHDSSPGELQFSAASYSVDENGGSALITVKRVNGGDCSASIDYATSDGGALAGVNYTATSGTLSWVDGDVSEQSFSVPILEDGQFGGDVTVNLLLSSPVGASLGAPSSSVLTILETDPSGSPELQTTLSCDIGTSEFTCLQTISNTGSATAVGVNVVYEVVQGSISSVEIMEGGSALRHASLVQNAASSSLSCDSSYQNCSVGNINSGASLSLLIQGSVANAESFSLSSTVANQSGSTTNSATASGTANNVAGGGCALEGNAMQAGYGAWLCFGVLLASLRHRIKRSERA